jgi:hypothetical protein
VGISFTLVSPSPGGNFLLQFSSSAQILFLISFCRALISGASYRFLRASRGSADFPQFGFGRRSALLFSVAARLSFVLAMVLR